MPAPFDDRPWAALDVSEDPRLAAVPTMMAEEECRFYYWATRDWMEGRGAVVDLGAFVGGSTARLAAGHADGVRPGFVHAYDKFTVDEKTKRRMLYNRGVAPFEGNDMLWLAERHLAPWADRVRLHRGEITELGWDGGPIEILAVDAAKKTELCDRMTAQFFPSLLPGALLIHQDFLHWSQPWLAAQMARFGDAFTPVAFCREDTVAFRCERAIGPADLAAAAVAGLDDTALFEGIATMRNRLSHWPLGVRFDAMERGLRRNPGVRVAWQMKM
ncbi:hypothetical protein [Oceaniglobus roseus]|uniref:hypothetical protein n=1 Tax=Oceaniglobus roseus TaxID=1737570 RepID=UPI000C7EE922|nr:hypothetical protein [Kandeliimicrobium roseum]